jgi:hypothetical protein
MDLQEIDGNLRRLRDAAEAIRSNLLEVELDPNRKLLDSSALAGESSKRWSEASTTLAQLWQWHQQLERLLDRATQLRGDRARVADKRLEELGELLCGSSIELPSEHVPLEQRHLLDGSGSTLRCTPDELLESSSAAFDQAKTVLAAVGNAWEELLPRLHAARGELSQSAELAQSLGDGEPPELDRVRSRISELSERLSKDPLSVRGEEVQELERALAAVRNDLDGLNSVRREIAALLADARKLLEQLRGVAREGCQAHEQTLAKIAAPAVPDPLYVDEALESQLEDVEKIARHGAWREARAVLEQWTKRTRSLLEQASRVASENRAPIQTRNELRGLLDACQAKALRLGLIEELELSGMFKAAQQTLYTAPTDLASATELVDRYRRALAEHHPRELSR